MKDGFNLESFLGEIKKHSFSKPYSFRVSIEPLYSEHSSLLSLYTKAATIPTHTNTITNLPHKGRIMKVPGEKTYPEWTCTIISDETHKIRELFEDWSDLISKSGTGFREAKNEGRQTLNSIYGPTVSEVSKYSSHYRDVVIDQLGSDNTIVKTYTLRQAWPTVISQMELNAESISNTQDLTVTFAYQYYIIGQPDAVYSSIS